VCSIVGAGVMVPVPMASAVMTSNLMQQQSMQPHGKHPGKILAFTSLQQYD
jgi:hypothetical protein